MLGLCLALLSLGARAEVLVVTDRQHPVQSVPNARVIELDAPGRIEADLAANLPTDPDQAAATMQQRLQQGGDPLQRRLGAAWQGVAESWGLGIAKVPAVVVDRRYVVYGQPDVAAAVARIDSFRRTQP
ncbi:TIGR03757 family integrating conjugative element protein [Sodalis sp. RH19]|uniref:TIGR03757 family integrating conjugative element protein n=1 Tax=Sodalis sp. RH19 TaxID=3394334 RepID=UPI0039B659DB